MQRNTVQRDIIKNVIGRMVNHPTADQVYEKVHEDYSNISRATVFRVLADLEKSGEIMKVDFPGNARRYDHVPDGHYHILCSECKEIYDVDWKDISQLDEEIKAVDALSGNKITGFNLVFKGICKECQKNIDNRKGE